jgi:uncharacterized protein
VTRPTPSVGPAAVARVVATPAARNAIRRLRSEHTSVKFYLSGGCCDGSAPLCFADGELVRSDRDVPLGEVAGATVYVDPRQLEVWGNSQVLLDVADGEPEGFSLPAGPGHHFVARSRICASESLSPIGPARRFGRT